jgi:fructose-specific phosphotransferase system IIA component
MVIEYAIINARSKKYQMGKGAENMETIINGNLIELNLEGNTKSEVIDYMASILDIQGRLKEKEEYVKEVLAREELTSTAVGFGVAIPHGKTQAVKIPSVVFGRSLKGIQWDSLDGELVNLVFLLAVPEEAASNQHLKILAALSRKLMNEEFRELLLVTEDKNILIKELQEILANVNK